MNLEDCRKEIDCIDSEIVDAFVKRMKISEEISKIKKAEGLPVFNGEREKKVIKNAMLSADEKYKPYIEELYIKILELSKEIQIED